MKFMAILTLFCVSVAFGAVQPAVTNVDVKKIDALASSYFLQKYKLKKMNLFETLSRVGADHVPPGCDPHYPPPNQNECIDVACNKLGTYGCDQQSEVSEVIAACRGVDADCVEASCGYLGTYGCDQMSEIVAVANNCRQIFDGRCMEVVCTKLGTYGCDQLSEVQQVGAICKGRVDSGCIESVCARLGTYGCDQMSEVQQVAKSCGGN